MFRKISIVTVSVVFVVVVTTIAVTRVRQAAAVGTPTALRASFKTLSETRAAIPGSASAVVLPVIQRVGLGADEARAAGGAFAKSMEIYLTGDVNAFQKWSSSLKLIPRDKLTGPDAASQWDRSTRGVRDAEFDLSGLKSVLVASRGKAFDPFTAAKERTAVAPGLLDAYPELSRSHPESCVIEIQVPMQMKASKDKLYEAMFCLQFARRPSDGQWIVIQTGIRNIPPETASRVPFPPV